MSGGNNEDRFDGLFMTAIQQSHGIDNFFNNLFSFMRRKTDFFTLADKSKTIVLSSLDEHMKIYADDKQREVALKAKQDQERKKREMDEAVAAAAKQSSVPSGVELQEVSEEEAQ